MGRPEAGGSKNQEDGKKREGNKGLHLRPKGKSRMNLNPAFADGNFSE